MTFAKSFVLIGVVSFAGLTIDAASYAQSSVDEQSIPTPLVSPEPDPPTAPEAIEAPAPEVDEVTACPSGQFPSAFSDVLPTHWAYAAVNSLADEPIQCFDWPETAS